jgi:putative hydrolase of the HAD superfamily
MAKFKAILFDLDNTLTDFMRMKEECINASVRAMVEAGLPLTEKKAHKKFFEFYWEHGIENQRIFQKFIKKVMGKIDYKVLAAAITAYRRAQVGVLIPYPHTRSTLIKLKEKGLKLGIVSDAPRMRAWMRLTEMDLTDYFDFVITVGDVKRLKPSKMPFNAALKKLKFKPEQIIFVGDNPKRDIAGAKAMGMKTALAKYGVRKPSKTIKADFDLNSIKDLLKLV